MSVIDLHWNVAHPAMITSNIYSSRKTIRFSDTKVTFTYVHILYVTSGTPRIARNQAVMSPDPENISFVWARPRWIHQHVKA